MHNQGKLFTEMMNLILGMKQIYSLENIIASWYQLKDCFQNQ